LGITTLRKNFEEFGDSPQIQQSSTRPLLVVIVPGSANQKPEEVVRIGEDIHQGSKIF